MLLSDLNFQINRDTEKPTVPKLSIRYDSQGKHKCYVIQIMLYFLGLSLKLMYYLFRIIPVPF